MTKGHTMRLRVQCVRMLERGLARVARGETGAVRARLRASYIGTGAYSAAHGRAQARRRQAGRPLGRAGGGTGGW